MAYDYVTTLATGGVGVSTRGVALDSTDSFAYIVTATGSASFQVWDAGALTLVTSLDLVGAGYTGAAAIVISPDDAFAYVICETSGELLKIDLSGPTVVDTLLVGGSDLVISSDGSIVYVAAVTATVAVDTATMTFVTPVYDTPELNYVKGLGLGNGNLYRAGFLDPSGQAGVNVWDLPTREWLNIILGFGEYNSDLFDIVISNDGAAIYGIMQQTILNPSWLVILDATNFRPLAAYIPLEFPQFGVGISPDDEIVFLAQGIYRTLLSTQEPYGNSYPLGNPADTFACFQDRSRVFIASQLNDTVVVDGS